MVSARNAVELATVASRDAKLFLMAREFLGTCAVESWEPVPRT